MSSRMITAAREKPRGKSVLLFSGGMDSLCFDRLCNPDILLYCPTGSSYVGVETARIHGLVNTGFINGRKVVIAQNVINLKHWERDDAIVPNRNAHLVLVASMFGETIWLGSVSGDRSADKDVGFYRHMEGLLNHMWREQHWTEERRFTVGSPYKEITKTKLVAEWLGSGVAHPEQAMRLSYSCYRGADVHCGVCKPCSRKRVALENNDLFLTNYWEANFWETAWFAELWPSIQTGTYRGEEDKDFVHFMQRRGLA